MNDFLSHSTKSGRKLTRFHRSPRMSTYLVAFIISDFYYKEKVTENGFTHRIFTQPKKIGKVEYALAESEKILNTLNDYLQVNFSLPKMDQVAVPVFLEMGLYDFICLVQYKISMILFVSFILN